MGTPKREAGRGTVGSSVSARVGGRPSRAGRSSSKWCSDMVLRFRGAGLAMREEWQLRSASLRAASREAAEAAVMAHGDAVSPADVVAVSRGEEPVGPPRYFASAVGQATHISNVCSSAPIEGAAGRDSMLDDAAVRSRGASLLASMTSMLSNVPRVAAHTARELRSSVMNTIAVDIVAGDARVPALVSNMDASAQLQALMVDLRAQDARLNLDDGTWEGRSISEVAASAIARLPIEERADRDVSDKLRSTLELVGRAWDAYLDTRPDMAARLRGSKVTMPAGAERSPLWFWSRTPVVSCSVPTIADTVAWSKFLLTTRVNQSVNSDLMGRTRDSVEKVYLSAAMCHLWRVLYPSMQSMPASEWRAYWAAVMAQFHAFFTDEGRRRWVSCASDEAAACVRARGGSQEEIDAAIEEARERTIKGIRAATSQPLQRKHASLCDLYIVQDLLLDADNVRTCQYTHWDICRMCAC